jgi:hypothetical protein
MWRATPISAIHPIFAVFLQFAFGLAIGNFASEIDEKF